MGGHGEYSIGYAFLAAAILPFFLALRWRGVGFILSVLIGWGVVHAANLVFPRHEPVDGVFVGVWAALGWIYMLVWCLLCAAIMATVKLAIGKPWSQASTDAD